MEIFLDSWSDIYVAIEWVTPLLPIREVPSSIIGSEASYSD
jgi:hypothetical protein